MTPRPRHIAYPLVSLVIDLVLLILAERVAPLDWELPDDRLQVALPLGIAALLTAFVVGGYRVEFPIRRSRAAVGGLGLALGVAAGWLLLKLVSQKAGLRELTPPAIEVLSLVLLGLLLLASLHRVVSLSVLRRLERARTIGILSDDPELPIRLRRDGLTEALVLVTAAELSREGLAELRALVIAMPLSTLSSKQLEAIAFARGVGLPIMTLSRFEEDVFRRVPLAQHDPMLILDEALSHRSLTYLSAKRLLDVVSALVLLALSALPLMVAAVLIRLESRGPIIYRQVRAGLHGRPFTMYKLRTMRDRAEPDGPVFASEGDPRVTRVGRWLRQTRMDELPQLVNILRNEMSLVGPRPERPEHDTHLAPLIPYYELRTLTKPGITGWAQVKAGYTDSPERARVKLEYDLYYLKYASLSLDLRIMLATALVVARRGGR
jgi:lipopolysaccharide/colanic/teichoic acid biosynthesis glycosyltransferase